MSALNRTARLDRPGGIKGLKKADEIFRRSQYSSA
jgi:hypothetical protein